MPPMKDKVRADGAKIRALRTRAHLKQWQLAELCMISRTYLSEIELGKKDPGARVVHKIAGVLKVKPQRLILEYLGR